LLGELQVDGTTIVCDTEAGIGTVLRLQPGYVDHVVVVAEPSAKAVDVARRSARIASSRARVLVVANKVRDPEDVHSIRDAVGDHDLVVVPEDPVVERADREGVAPIDLDVDAPAVVALRALADRLLSA
jgi:CO dehydrogenase nickel-insertion accessory protein CooC1